MPFVEFNVQIDGVPELRRKLRKLDDAIKEKVRYALAFEGEKIKATAESLCPFVSGYLQSTIYVRMDGFTLTVGASAHYARYVEFGTRYMEGRHFLSRAVQRHMPNLIAVVRQAIKDAVEEVSRR